MKLRVHPWRLIWRFLIVMLAIYIIVIISFNSLFISFNFDTGEFYILPFGMYHYIILIGIPVLGIIAFIPILTSFYYVVEKKYFLMRRYGKEFEYHYANIEFIDIETSRRKKMVIFYAPTCKTKYLLGDKDGVLLDTLIKKCPNIYGVEEFRRRHPEEKY